MRTFLQLSTSHSHFGLDFSTSSYWGVPPERLLVNRVCGDWAASGGPVVSSRMGAEGESGVGRPGGGVEDGGEREGALVSDAVATETVGEGRSEDL